MTSEWVGDKPLEGACILVTRPRNQADRLCELIEAIGGKAIRLPAIEIIGLPVTEQVQTLIDEAAGGDWLIFVSANAVRYAAPLLPEEIPAQIAVLGPATAAAAKSAGWTVACEATHASSESLLEQPSMEGITGQKITLIAGQGGREILQTKLAERGALLTRIEVYRRDLPQLLKHEKKLLAVLNTLVDAVVLTSGEGAQNFIRLYENSCQTLPLKVLPVVMSQRIADLGVMQGFDQRPVIAIHPSDEGILNSLIEWWQHSQ